MIWPNSLCTKINDNLNQLDGLILPSLIPIRCCQIGHAGQRGWMLFFQHSLSRLHHLHVQLLGLIPPSLIPVR